jgi:acetylornithine deacetylase
MAGVHASGCSTYGSPTLSDQAQMPFPTIKFGPGDSARSHTADEYIEHDEIPRAVDIIIRIIEGYGI